MVFHCRCFSFSLQENEEIEYETITQTNSTMTETFHTACSDFSLSVSNFHSKTTEFPNLAEKPSNLRVFTVAELKAATKNFCGEYKLGEGGFGSVYKGVVKSLEYPFHEVQVAVKYADGVL
ncbi:putative transferase [Helianthus annuus]|uniref:Transferase n=1 Tax=Helianthus annuus TaxID=4232 RepID=A0A9K3HTS5_HELAN|nr:putative transferase [Helianthus annuus]KAJ0519256.1 putative transferase [Helianthus annuus]KAJ0877123.1 putative transferase [Helianthus annuus]